MAITGCTSSPADREGITSLLSEALGIDKSASALNPQFQEWKYWKPHPLSHSIRSYILKNAETFVAHGCIWPIQLRAPSGTFMAFQLVDWAARPDVPGAGMQVLRRCSRGMAAAVSIGGSPAAQRILQATGFKTYNDMIFLSRPLRPLQSALEECPADWKTPARVLRNVAWRLFPVTNLPSGWKITFADPDKIPASLWPGEIAGQAVSVRTAELLSHIVDCPRTRRSACYVLQRGTVPVAYAVLAQVERQVRLADYGPPGLDAETCMALGMSVQLVACSTFPDATTVTAATTEAAVRLGFIRAGLRVRRVRPIRVLKLNQALNPIDWFRLTPIDWDAIFR